MTNTALMQLGYEYAQLMGMAPLPCFFDEKMPDGIDGMLRWDKDILVNPRQSDRAIHETIIHELVHQKLGRSMPGGMFMGMDHPTERVVEMLTEMVLSGALE